MTDHQRDNSSPICFILIADLHLSDIRGTGAHHVLDWAVETINQEKPDFLAVAGDMTTYGTMHSTARVIEALESVKVPVYFTPGNAELRSKGGRTFWGDWLLPANRYFAQAQLCALFPDTSTGTVPISEREWLEEMAVAHSSLRRILITHYPLDALASDSAVWLEQWISHHRIELLLAGHRHIHRQRRVGVTTEIVCRGLDPDKAIGDLPGLSLLRSERRGDWTEQFLPWSPDVELLPADLPKGIHPVGWSIQGNPVDAVRETREFGLSCLELRPRDLEFSGPILAEELARLRDCGPLYLSYHLPNLAWDGNGINGEESVHIGLDIALEAGVDSLTVHSPRAPSGEMMKGGRPTELYLSFQDLYARLFADPVRSGMRLAIENVHNPLQTPVDSSTLEFATRIEEYICWIDALVDIMTTPQTIGVLLDVGHARNNGGDLDNMQPLGDWYACVGSRILGYHIHQVCQDPKLAKAANHQAITNFFGKRISYAGFLYSWSIRQVTRAPLFVEVRQAEARRETVTRLKQLFANADRINQAIDLPDRANK